MKTEDHIFLWEMLMLLMGKELEVRGAQMESPKETGMKGLRVFMFICK